jgi:hypothetical protein
MDDRRRAYFLHRRTKEGWDTMPTRSSTPATSRSGLQFRRRVRGSAAVLRPEALARLWLDPLYNPIVRIPYLSALLCNVAFLFCLPLGDTAFGPFPSSPSITPGSKDKPYRERWLRIEFMLRALAKKLRAVS